MPSPQCVCPTGATGYTGSTFVHLIGVAHPGPARAEQFRSIDLAARYSCFLMYRLGALVPLTREGARRLGLVTLAQMLQALVWAIERPATALRVLEVPDIRRGALPDT